MARSLLPALVALPLVLSACGTPPMTSSAPTASAAHPSNVQLELALASGDYSCDGGARVQVHRDLAGPVNTRIHIGWNGSGYWLKRDPSYSGLPRFEDASSGLVWIDMPTKSLLLDGRLNKPLANDCRPV